MEMLQKAMNDQVRQIMTGMTKVLNEKIEEVKQEVNTLKENTDGALSLLHHRVNKVGHQQARQGEGMAKYMAVIEEEIIELKKNIEKGGKKQEAVEGKWKEAERDIMMSQFHEMEYAIRIRGWKEEAGENLKEIFVKAVAEKLGEHGINMEANIVKIYRVNSWIARNKHLPRDVVIYFNSKIIRNEVVQNAYVEKMKVKGQEVIILKELPRKMLMMRKEYKFLTDKLKQHEMQFKWELPIGLSLVYDGKRHWLNTVEKARSFYEDMLKFGQPRREEEGLREDKKEEPLHASTPMGLLEKVESFQESSSEVRAEEVEFSLAPEMLSLEVPKDQRMTRAAVKKMEERQQQRQQDRQQKSYAEAVGGARPKTSLVEARGQFCELLRWQDDD